MSKYGRYQVPEAPQALLWHHFHDGATPLKEVDHEPRVAVLDQEDLLAQGIRCSEFIPGAQDADALGSCTANATTSALSNLLPEDEFLKVTGAASYTDTVGAEKFAIKFYHECSSQAGDPKSEWPPTDCGSSGPYIVEELKKLGLIKDAKIAHGADNIVSLMQSGGLLAGVPFLNSWEQPAADGFVDGDGSVDALQQALAQGVAGGHEIYLSAVEKLAFLPDGQVDALNTVIRFRNSWSSDWADHGSARFHLSTLVMLGGYADFRLLVK